jgi:PAS domain S-box-containing protein
MTVSRVHESDTIEASINACHTPLLVVDGEAKLVFANKSGYGWLSTHNIPLEQVSLTELFKPTHTSETLSDILKEVIGQQHSNVRQFHSTREAEGNTLEVLMYPFQWKRSTLAAIQPIRISQYPDAHPEARLNLNLLIEERTAEIQDLNSFLESILDSSTENFIIAVGSNGTILSFNTGACQLFGYLKREAVGRIHVRQLFAESEHDQRTWAAMAKDAAETGKSRRTVRLRRKDDSIFPALVDLTPLKNTESEAMGMLFVGRDVSDTIRTQRELEERKVELEFINKLSLDISQTLQLENIAAISLRQMLQQFDSTNAGLYIKNKSTGELRLIVSEPDLDWSRPNPLLGVSAEEYVLLEEGQVLIKDVKFTDENSGGMVQGTKLFLPLLPKTTFIGVLVLVINRRVRRTVELLSFLAAIGATIGGAIENAILYFESLNKSLEIKKQNQELDEFAYVVSHDLKEPLAGISFISNLLVDEYFEKLDDTGKTYISSLIDFSKRLGSLIDALLDLSRIGRITQPPERVPIAQVMHAVQQNLSFRISRQNLNLIIPKILPEVFGDKTRIEQVFFNLVSNALKFNDKDTIEVEVGFNDIEGDLYLFFIRDNGIGIEKEYFEKIFKIFERLNQREEYEGTGAGLTIVKKIVEQHGGEIWLDSILSQGTTFYFTLPKFTNE